MPSLTFSKAFGVRGGWHPKLSGITAGFSVATNVGSSLVYGGTFFSLPPFKLFINSDPSKQKVWVGPKLFIQTYQNKNWVGPELFIHRNHVALINFQHESHQLTPPVLKLASQPNPPQKQGFI